VKQLLEEGNDPTELEQDIQRRLDDMDDLIKDVDFYISVPQLSKTVQPITDKILKNL
jgi:hypothetical protein